MMTIGHLFRRYKGWNPVHPTYGAFWGIGVGLGCGVGWGPGFGPEAIGFVGSGCGVGFNVGVTFIGFGVGLPSKGFTCFPWNALVWTSKGASNVSSTIIFPSLIFMAQQSWNVLSSQVAALDSGVQKLYNSHMPRSRKSILERRKEFFRKAQDSLSKSRVQKDNVLQLQPLVDDSLSESLPGVQAVSLTSPQKAPTQTNGPRDFLPPARRELQARDLPDSSKEKK